MELFGPPRVPPRRGAGAARGCNPPIDTKRNEKCPPVPPVRAVGAAGRGAGGWTEGGGGGGRLSRGSSTCPSGTGHRHHRLPRPRCYFFPIETNVSRRHPRREAAARAPLTPPVLCGSRRHAERGGAVPKHRVFCPYGRATAEGERYRAGRAGTGGSEGKRELHRAALQEAKKRRLFCGTEHLPRPAAGPAALLHSAANPPPPTRLW